ncbi:MAG TPA: ribosome small subunit-dependent GTPase A [Bacteroidales bacterium]|nr:MAG: ribosome small subunit-dependent GTPase A [Bacteroidetes bacterium GWF2_33_38]OFY76250.1 MAG: ribosome small subunit-dependent GTPase A [Bacteroidetes bacterium RIFOXYA12_FULL_33_9]OFY85004.1 MAG: ribosome small subunit-dependent GTPase A [Bacteroidetes bacterium RIFOXYA2_FULL_33_7]HBF87411.1 ribosome small subunit-dependent GTPase A [Bacteroidales bacterium]
MNKGIVIKSTGSWFSVKNDDNQIFECRIRGKIRLDDLKSTNPVAVGDVVEFSLAEDNVGLISKIYERKNYIIRKSSNLSKQHHIVASNIDQAFLVITLAFPETSTLFIDRFLISAEAYRIPTIIVINKVDLYKSEKLSELVNQIKSIYNPIGYKCIETSVVENVNIDLLRELMCDKVSVFSGNSGVGKSSLINKIDSKLNIRVGEISDSHHKGKHTTTFAEMHHVSSGGYIIDTPGIKGFGLIDMKKEEMYHFFPEIFNYSAQCKYNNCTHVHEPNCAVIQHVKDGDISLSRYENYLNLILSDEEKHR